MVVFVCFGGFFWCFFSNFRAEESFFYFAFFVAFFLNPRALFFFSAIFECLGVLFVFFLCVDGFYFHFLMFWGVFGIFLTIFDGFSGVFLAANDDG
jgi:hypothetical protein